MIHRPSFSRRFSPAAKLKPNRSDFALLNWALLALCTIVAGNSEAAEPRWRSVPLGGGGYVTGLVSSASDSAVYCRTDVGGAFRWDAPKGEWLSITDRIVPVTTEHAANLMSIPAIAVDPNNPNQLYVAAGDSPFAALHGIYASSDRGATWTAINSTFIMDGNGPFRTVGERLAVDPNNSNVLWYGSSHDGLQRGTRSGATWSWAQIPSSAVPFGTVPEKANKAGVTFVACDKNGRSTIVYAGVYDTVGATGGVYRSADGGAGWSKVPGIDLKTPLRGEVASNGTLYVTQKGVVAKMLRGGELTAVTPEPGIAYRGISVAPSDPTGNTVYVAESSPGHHGKIWRSTDGGAKWAMQSTTFNEGAITSKGHARNEPDGTPTLTGYWFGATATLMVNPKNPNELWAGDFFGVLRTQNAQEIGNTPGAQWHLLQKGQEETCVEALKNAPTGARLMAGFADVGGFSYVNTKARPGGQNGNAFGNPRGGSTVGLDFCESAPKVWARTWVEPAHNGGSGAASSDGGVTWLAFGQIAARSVRNTPNAGAETWDVSTYLSKQKARGASAVTLVLCSGNTANYSADALKFESKDTTGGENPPKLVINGTTTLTATDDASVSNGATDANSGTKADLLVSYAYGNAPHSNWSYLKFDLSSVPAINSAILQLNRKAATNTTEYQVGVYACLNTAWKEAEITWANKPTLLASPSDPIGNPKYFDGRTPLTGGRIAVSATDPNRFLWMPEGKGTLPRYSLDRGVTWTVCTGAPGSVMDTQFNPGVVIQQIASDRVNGKFYVGKLGTDKHTIYSSTDGGVTFAPRGSVPGGYNMYRVQLVTAPAANDVWLCDDGIKGSAAGGLWRSTDGAETWGPKFAGITAVRQVTFGKAQSGAGYSVFINGYKDGSKGVYRSDDYGVTWIALEPFPTAASIDVMAGDRQNYGKVFVGTGGRGVFEGQ